MAEFKVKTRGNADPNGKPRLYFTCHPDDFASYFDRICNDIFSIKELDPAIYYTDNMSEPLDDNNINVDLAKMKLFIIPVTFKLMSEPNRAMQVDIAYAKEHNIKILPFVMEEGIDSVYSLPKNFAEMQYINPNSNDITEIKYTDKLKKYLESVLISDEMAQRVRAAFDAYIFLSYRKKDRRYANELMRIIHNIPGCRDIAIWYDEFLAIGESWRENIKQAMKMVKERSNLFTLLVTPNLLEEYLDENGELKKNFVMGNEYPEARKMDMDILPAEMERTDRESLIEKFEEIPDPIKVDDEHFDKELLAVIEKIAISENDGDPEHNFLIGLAYLDGIDVEVDVERGLELITKAAEDDLPEAIYKLYVIYLEGDRVQPDYREALKWIQRLVDIYSKEYGEENPDTLIYMDCLAYIYNVLGEHDRAIEIYEKVYARMRSKDEDDPDLIIALSNVAYTYGKMGNVKKALELKKKVYSLSCKQNGSKHPTSIIYLSNLASAYSHCGDHEKALELKKKAYKESCKIHGEKHTYTLKVLNNLASTYFDLKQYGPAIELFKKGYELSVEVNGEENPDTLKFLANLGNTYGQNGDYDTALKLGQRAYDLRCRILGPEHPDTLVSVNNLAYVYSSLGEGEKALELFDSCYSSYKRILGSEHPTTLAIMLNLTVMCCVQGKTVKARFLIQDLYPMAKKAWKPDSEHMVGVRMIYNRLIGRKS